MAQLGKFGIAHPIYNSRFNIAKKAVATYFGTASNTITVTIPVGIPRDLDHFFGPADTVEKQDSGKWNKIIVGPNTAGNIEVFDVLDATPDGSTRSIITIDKALVATYLAGDSVTMIGTGMPDGWIGSGTLFSAGAIADGGGYIDPYSFNLVDTTGYGHGSNFALFDIGNLLANNFYILTVLYKTDGTFNLDGTETRSVSVSQNQGGSISEIVASRILFSVNTSWTAATVVFTTSDDQTGTGRLLVTNGQIAASIGTEVRIGSISLTHALFGSDSEYDTDGVIQLSEWPVLGSVSIKRRYEGSKIIQNLDGSRMSSQTLDNQIMPLTKFTLDYQFDRLANASLLQFRNLLDWQQRGYLINHFPGLVGVPYCLTGRIKLSGQRGEMDDLSLRDVSLTFEEVVT
jgi:hypothetical protein